MQFFVFMLVLAWLPLTAWWVIAPRYFPFFKDKSLGRFAILGINLLFWFCLLLLIGVMPIANPKMGVIDALGMFAGLGATVFLFVYSIKTKRPTPLKTSVEPTPKRAPPATEPLIIEKADEPISTPKQSEEIPVTVRVTIDDKPKKRVPRPKPPMASEPPAKPALKEDFELGDDDFCDMKYQNAEGVISTRKILIRKLKASNNGDWLVSAVDLDAKKLKNFRVDRIVSLSHNNQTWTKYEDILGVVRTFETII